MLTQVVRADLGVDEAFDALAAAVDPTHAPGAKAAEFLSASLWPGFWDGWAREARERDAALRVTSAVCRAGARRTCQRLRLEALVDAEGEAAAGEEEATVRAKRAKMKTVSKTKQKNIKREERWTSRCCSEPLTCSRP